MIRFYKTLQPAALFFIPVITLLFWLPAFFKQDFLVTERTGFIDHLIINAVAVLPKFFQILLAVMLISTEAVYLTLVVNRHEVLYKNTYLPALIYVLLMSFHSGVIVFHQMLFINFILIIVCDKIFYLFKNDNPVSLIFDCGLLLSIASLIYFPCFILLFFFLLVLVILRSVNLREWAIAAVAFLIPYFFLSVYCFMTDSLNIETIKLIIADWTFHFSLFTFHFSGLPFVIFFFIMLSLSLVR